MKDSFEAVLLRCAEGHYEATTLQAYNSDNRARDDGAGIGCARCHGYMRVVKVATIHLATKPAGAPLRV